MRLERLHQFEDMMNMEFLYHKTTEQIVLQYLYQKEVFADDHNYFKQDFQLTKKEIEIIDTLIKI